MVEYFSSYRHIVSIVIAVGALLAQIVGHAQSKVGVYTEYTHSDAVFDVGTGQALDEQLSPFTAINFGIEFERKVVNRFSVVSGIGYLRMGFAFEDYFVQSSFHDIRTFVKIPLMVRYDVLSGNKFGLGIGAGITNNFLFRSRVELFDYNAPTPALGNESYLPDPSTLEYDRVGFDEIDDSGFHIYNIGVAANLLFSYALAERFHVAAGPTAEYLLNSTNRGNKSVQEHFYNYGLRLAVDYCFQRTRTGNR